MSTLETQCVFVLVREGKKAYELCVEVQLLKKNGARSAGPSRSEREKSKRARGVFSGSARKAAKADGQVKKLYPDGQESLQQRASVERAYRKVEFEKGGPQSKLQAVLCVWRR